LDKGAIAFVWENFGPSHADRCEAVAAHFAGRREVIGIELGATSHTYIWEPVEGRGFRKVTLFPQGAIDRVGLLARVRKTWRACLPASDIFFCHYEHPATFLCAALLRASGRRVYVMNDSKFDDRPRRRSRERAKALLHRPYQGGIAAGARAKTYMQGMGVPRVEENYDNISVERIRRLAKAPPAPDGAAFTDRHFTIVARFVPKKNLLTALDAYELYRRRPSRPRELHLIGSGPLEEGLRAKVRTLGLEHLVHFWGFLQTEQVCEKLAASLALILPSTEEQFGIAALEAIMMGVPVIVSENCGVRDSFVRDGVDGFVVKAHDAQAIANYMGLIAADEGLWRKLARGCAPFAQAGDASHFAQSVEKLIAGPGETSPRPSL
jgi:glycosyltransferase involved in cell wall biosynthesis